MDGKLEKLKESKILWYGASTLILLTLVYMADFGDFIQALTQVDPFYMSLAAVSGLSVYLVWGFVWFRFFTKMDIEYSLWKSYKMFMAGNFMNSVTPLGQLGGEPFMAYVVSKNTGSSYERALSAVVSSDLLNSIPIVTYMTIGTLYLVLFGGGTLLGGTGIVRMAIYAVLFLSITAVLLGYFLWSGHVGIESWIISIIKKIEERLPHLQNSIRMAREKLGELRKTFREAGDDPVYLAETAAISHLALPTQFISLYFILLGLGIEPTIIGIIFTIIMSGVAVFFPTPGGSGTFEAAFTLLLRVFYPGIGLDVAVAAAVLFRLSTFWVGIPLGYLALINLRKGEKPE
jgi:uncharacterized protein (TIRG00374 family)